MKVAFDELSGRARLNRLRRLANVGLSKYGIRAARLRLLRYAEKATFRVDALTSETFPGETAGPRESLHRYALCIYNRDYFDAEELRSGLIWLSAIRRETGLSVPEPVTNLDGTPLSEIVPDDDPRKWFCVVFHWMKGRVIKSPLSVYAMERIGTYVARLHAYGATFVPLPGFYRHRYDGTGIFGAYMTKKLSSISSLCSDSDYSLLVTVLERVRREMRRDDRGPENFGLIHADLHLGNFLLYKGEVRGIDFDDCGWGYYLYDVAVLLSYLERHDKFPALRAAVLNAYSRLRPIDAEAERKLPTFIAAYRLHQTVDMIKQSHQPWLRDSVQAFLKPIYKGLRAYVNEAGV